MTITYEQLRMELETLTAADGEARHLRWLARELAVGRNAGGDYEIFLRGNCLSTNSTLVRRHVQHGEWMPREGGEAFAASRIVLPSAPHFASVAALIAIELLRAGISGSNEPQQAFSDVEPIIEMAIRRGALPENVIIGLIGELILVRQCLVITMSKPVRHSEILNAWQGWQHGGRDFLLGSVSIEVKTTQATNSIHEFSGLHQLESKRLQSGELEELYLLSIGMIASSTSGESLPELIESILTLLAAGCDRSALPLQQAFLNNVEAYGSQNGTGYTHTTMNKWSVYLTRYSHTYPPRLYRVEDPAMKLLRRTDVENTFVVPSSLAFTLLLPDHVSAFNPVESWQPFIAEIVKSIN